MRLEIFRPKNFFEFLYQSGFQPSYGTSLQLRYLYPSLVGLSALFSIILSRMARELSAIANRQPYPISDFSQHLFGF